MSVAIATMGMVVQQIAYDDGSSGYGYKERQPKPQIIINRVEQYDDKIADIKVRLIEGEDA